MQTMNKAKNETLKKQAVTIASEISHLITQYTHDSFTSKFFLTDEIGTNFYIAAGGFAAVIYEPQLEADEVQNIHALSFFLILITYGFQIYIRERSLRTNSSPYTLPTNKKKIEVANSVILERAETGNLVSSPLADEIIELTLMQVQKTLHEKDFTLAEHRLNEKKLYTYMTVSLYFGYNMAAELL